MTRNLILQLKPYFITPFVCCLISCDDEPKNTTYQTEAQGTPCNCETAWFPHSQTPAPLEGNGSPFDTTSTTNCIFHQWSWQKFLWLTKPQSNGKPLFLNELILVSPAMALVTPQKGTKLVLSSIDQAGGNDAVLKTNPTFNSEKIKSDTIYYSIHMDSTMYKAATSFATDINNGSLPSSNTKTFPVNSLELKVAWVDLNAIDTSKQGSYFQTEAAIELSDGSYKTITVALIGMHVVGVVINHPEFIWATFEHKGMAPIYDWNTGSVSSGSETLLYHEGATTGLGGIQWDKTAENPVAPHEAFTLFEFGVPMMSSDSFMLTSQSEPENFENIADINNCVASNLSDIWNNYFYKGSIWINTDGLSPSNQADTIIALAYGLSHAQPGAIVRGCVSLFKSFHGDLRTDLCQQHNFHCCQQYFQLFFLP